MLFLFEYYRLKSIHVLLGTVSLFPFETRLSLLLEGGDPFRTVCGAVQQEVQIPFHT